MAEETKKISFGFSKLRKTNMLVNPAEISKPQVDYVDSFDGSKGKFSYKGNVRNDKPVKKELVIPLIGTRTALDVIRSKLEENKIDEKKSEDCNEKVKTTDGNAANETVEEVSKGEINRSEGKDDNVQLSIDDLAAKEIISELYNKAAEEKASNAIIIKQPNKINNTADEKDGPIDYENIPVNDFGLAMLRGMGWTPQTGTGKEQKVVQVFIPKLRPKGLGLGADKILLQQANDNPNLTISIKSFVKFSNGFHKGKYGQVESMDEDNGRVIVKLALGGTVSVSEMLLTPVTKKDYEKNCKVLNPTSYESFTEPDTRPDGKIKSGKEKSSESGRKKHDDNRHRKEKYDRRESREREKEVSEGDSDTGRRESRCTSFSSERITDYKKKKKHARDNSHVRKHKKSKKKRKKRRKYSSDEESDSSPERRPERERSRNHSHHSKSKRNSLR